MTVNPKKNIATCFSCGATGNVISFVQKYEKQINNNNLTVNQAIAKVVEICHLNIDISHLNRQSYDKQYIIGSKRYSKREQELIEVNEFLAKLFHYNLTAIDKEPRNYLYSRNVDDKQIKELNLGYCKKGQFLNMAQKNEKVKKEDLLELGYLRIDDFGNLQESFTNRIMFPIQDEKGNVVSFAGRGIKDEVPKYLHTSESSIFKKKELLYNFSNAKTLSYNNELIIVEGFLDVVGARRIGYENVVATMGVALTPEHLKMIKRNHSSITLALDNDQAGHDAMLRLIPDLLQQGFKVNVIDISKLGEFKDFGDLSKNDIPFQDIQKSKISGFTFLLDYKYFKEQVFNAEKISLAYKSMKKDRLISNTYDDALFKEYIIDKTSYNKQELDEIMYPKKIEKKENEMDNLASRAMTNFLYTELLLQVDKKDDKVLSVYFNNHKEEIEKRLVSIFNANPEKYLEKNSKIKREELLSDFLKDNKEYSNYESLNRFKYINVFNKTYIKNFNGSARITLKDNQIQTVIKQYEDSLTDQEKLALEEVEELYIINNLDDIDGILSYNNKTLEIIKENIKERLFLNKGKMQFFKYGSLFLNIDKDFIDDKFKGKNGEFKTILFYNNLDNNLTLDKSNVVSNTEPIKEEIAISNEEQEKVKKEDYLFSINQVLLVPSLETDTHYFVRIPNTDAKEYFYIPKNECEWVDSGELFYTKLKYGDSYKIYNKLGEYICTKSFDELKFKWEDKTKKQSSTSNEIEKEVEENEDRIIYDNSYTSKYKEPISKIYHSKIYLETEKGFYIKTDNPTTLLFVVKKICNWTDDKSYLIVSPRKGFLNGSGISKYRLDGFTKIFEKKLSYNEINKYLKILLPKDSKKRDVITINFPKYKCRFNSNFVEIPMIIDNVQGYLNVNIIKTKINTESVLLEIDKTEQIGFHSKDGEYIDHYTGDKILDSYNHRNDDKVIEFPFEEKLDVPLYEKEAA